ncbi:hypothetical protein [Umezawaea sp.]|uniref:hypothetical protein n=1 Tax=Umezawaea sp. TaxID=1955258 RepID=UPI002ED3A604
MPEKTEVELDVFSGRPNPTWSLPDAQASTFRERVDGLPAATSGQVANNLGYRGFIVRAGDEVVLVQKGVVQKTRGETTEYAADPNRDLERWLLESGKPTLEPEVLTSVERELGG